jgi:hypothetical protein
MTENPRVVQGFIDIYGDWIERYRVDGFRIDTARHVNPEFWRAFVPAMLKRARAEACRISTSSAKWRRRRGRGAARAHTRVDKLPSVLDFGFAERVREVLAHDAGTTRWRGCMRTTACTKAAPRGAALADVYRQSRLRALRLAVRQASRTRAMKNPAARAAVQRDAVPVRGVPVSITATSRVSSVTASTRRRARTCSRARLRVTTTRHC